MKKSLDNEALQLTMEILENWFCEDGKIVYQYVGENMVWIGSTANQFYIGKEIVLEALHNARNGMLPCIMSGKRFIIADSGKNYCLVIGRYIVTLDCPGMYIKEPQRISCLWKIENDKLVIKHLHLSNTMAAVLPEEEFPVTASKLNYEYIQKRINEKNEVIHFITTDSKQCILSKNEIIYVEARKDYIHIFSKNIEYRVHSKFQEFINTKLSDFLIIHRSFAVNTQEIKMIRNKNVIMNNGIILPIARTRYAEVTEKLNKIYGN